MSDAAKVEVVGISPSAVEQAATLAASTQPSLPPKTTAQEDLTTKGQRTINIIWESTQAFIAGSITLAIIYCAIAKIENLTLTNAFFLIVGFYFSRTNHAAIGGVGWKPSEEYRGR